VRPIALDGSEDFLLLACDGLFDVMSNQKACSFAVEQLVKAKNDPAAAAHALARHAVFDLHSTDNVSVLIVLLRDVAADPPAPPPAGADEAEAPPPLGVLPSVPESPPVPPPVVAAEPAVEEAAAEEPTPPTPLAASKEQKSTRRAAIFKAGSPLGLQLGNEVKTGLLRISNIFEGGAASNAGLIKHDLLLAITNLGAVDDGEDCRLLSLEAATERIKKHLCNGGVRIVVETIKFKTGKI